MKRIRLWLKTLRIALDPVNFKDYWDTCSGDTTRPNYYRKCYPHKVYSNAVEMSENMFLYGVIDTRQRLIEAMQILQEVVCRALDYQEYERRTIYFYMASSKEMYGNTQISPTKYQLIAYAWPLEVELEKATTNFIARAGHASGGHKIFIHEEVFQEWLTKIKNN